MNHAHFVGDTCGASSGLTCRGCESAVPVHIATTVCGVRSHRTLELLRVGTLRERVPICTLNGTGLAVGQVSARMTDGSALEGAETRQVRTPRQRALQSRCREGALRCADNSRRSHGGLIASQTARSADFIEDLTHTRRGINTISTGEDVACSLHAGGKGTNDVRRVAILPRGVAGVPVAAPHIAVVFMYGISARVIEPGVVKTCDGAPVPLAVWGTAAEGQVAAASD